MCIRDSVWPADWIRDIQDLASKDYRVSSCAANASTWCVVMSSFDEATRFIHQECWGPRSTWPASWIDEALSSTDLRITACASTGLECVLVMSNNSCLLYTSDAADDLLCVDLGGRRIIKKKITCDHEGHD
eukprot:TRINITY_DN22745_c0_g1_i1.p1 TRINITY_DN22745_c0_g1~~TRINITY_DN22745_c0_g1_i1.p1  ORF type:complete len:131 (+),score=37.76 TRINITY_DN22745_c0_g1_i1:62-454(+)